jgi:hypothetical protein
LKLGAHVNFRISVELADKLQLYANQNQTNVSQSIIELIEFAMELKPMLKEIKEDPNKLKEILLEIKAKESEQGLIEYINSKTEVQQKGILKFLEMKRDGAWK